MVPNQLQFIKKVLYHLKQRYGAKIEYYHVTSNTTDDETGIGSILKLKFVIKRAIRLPDKRTRGFQYDLSFIAANKNFTMGATYDRNARDFIISRSDLPKDFEPGIEDYILMSNQRYNVKQLIELDFKQGYYISGEATEGESLGAVHDIKVSDGIDMSQQTGEAK